MGAARPRPPVSHLRQPRGGRTVSTGGAGRVRRSGDHDFTDGPSTRESGGSRLRATTVRAPNPTSAGPCMCVRRRAPRRSPKATSASPVRPSPASAPPSACAGRAGSRRGECRSARLASSDAASGRPPAALVVTFGGPSRSRHCRTEPGPVAPTDRASLGSRTATRARFDPGQRTACRSTSPHSGLTRFSASRRARWLADWRWLIARRGERIRARLRGVNPIRHPRCSRGCPGPRVSREARVDRR